MGRGTQACTPQPRSEACAMNLFAPDATSNLLPCDGTVHYCGHILGPVEARRYFDALLDKVPWKHDEAIMFGKRIVTARKVAWYGDAAFPYAYSGTTKQALPWTVELLALKALVEQRAGAKFNLDAEGRSSPEVG